MSLLRITLDPEICCFPKIILKIIAAASDAARTVFDSLDQTDRYQIGLATEIGLSPLPGWLAARRMSATTSFKHKTAQRRRRQSHIPASPVPTSRPVEDDSGIGASAREYTSKF